MQAISRDPIINAINNGIRRDISVSIENNCFRAAVILIYSGIDAMAHLYRPAPRKYNEPVDFKNWVAKYFHVRGQTDITPEEWWAARNAIVHTYTVYSRRHESGNVRVLGYTVGAYPHVSYNKAVDPNVVLVDILGMRDALFSGIEKFLIDGFADPGRKQLMEQRIQEWILVLPFQDEQ